MPLRKIRTSVVMLHTLQQGGITHLAAGCISRTPYLLLLLKAVNGRHLKLSDKHPRTLDSLNNLIELYEAWGKPEKAEKWRAKLPDAETEFSVGTEVDTSGYYR